MKIEVFYKALKLIQCFYHTHQRSGLLFSFEKATAYPGKSIEVKYKGYDELDRLTASAIRLSSTTVRNFECLVFLGILNHCYPIGCLQIHTISRHFSDHKHCQHQDEV